MTLRDCLELLNGHGGLILLSGIGFAVMGAIATRIGKAGQSEEDGKFIGGVVAAFGIVSVLAEALVLIIVWRINAKALADASLALLLAPPACCAASLWGVSLSFPLKSLGGFQRMMSLAGLTAASLAVLWLLSRFHWGIIFFGGLAQAGIIFLAIALLIRTLYRQAFGPAESTKEGGETAPTPDEEGKE